MKRFETGYTDSKITVLDDFMDDLYLNTMREEAIKLEDNMKLQEGNPYYIYRRAHLDDIFEGDSRIDSKIIQLLSGSLFEESVRNELLKVNDFCTQMFKHCNYHMTYITSHIPGKTCGWHKDDATNHLLVRVVFLLNYILYIDVGSKFTGGDLIVSYDHIKQKSGVWLPETEPVKHERIAHKNNRLVIMPTYLWHMVEPIKLLEGKKYNSGMDGRVTINGHIGWKIQ